MKVQKIADDDNLCSEELLSPFGKGFAFSVKRPRDIENFTLHPEESQILSPKAIAKRRRDFHMGRLAARCALEQLKIFDYPVLRSEHNEPVWPPDIVGSITHTGGIAAAAAAFRQATAGIGIDIENVYRDVSFDIAKMVCTPDEIEWVRQKEPRVERLLTIFSAKESVFKAFFPIEKVFLEFHDAQLTREADGFSGRLLKQAGRKYPVGYRFYVGIRRYRNYVFTYLTLPI